VEILPAFQLTIFYKNYLEVFMAVEQCKKCNKFKQGSGFTCSNCGDTEWGGIIVGLVISAIAFAGAIFGVPFLEGNFFRWIAGIAGALFLAVMVSSIIDHNKAAEKREAYKLIAVQEHKKAMEAEIVAKKVAEEKRAQAILKKEEEKAKQLYEQELNRKIEKLILDLSDKRTIVERMETEDELAKIGKPAIPGLIRTLHDPDLGVSASSALEKMGNLPLLELIEALNDPVWNVRMLAAKSLGRIGDQFAVNPLFKALDDPQPEVRKYVYEALGEFGGSKVKYILQLRSVDETSPIALSGIEEAFRKMQ